MAEKIKCLIIGAGPAGYSAAIYASRANLSPVLYEGLQPGGQLTTTTSVENFPGFPEGVDGNDLMDLMRQQSINLGADVRSGRIVSVDLSSRPFKAVADSDAELLADGIIIATGASAKYLGLDDEETYRGKGVSACATCDGFFFRKKTVAVVGGGDTACEEALYLSNLAQKVYMIVRKNYLRASEVMKSRVEQNPNIEVLYEHNTVGLFGDGKLQGAHLVHRMGQPDESKVDIAIDGFFLAIGHQPNSSLFSGQLELDENGFIKTLNGTTETNVPGVFAAGDVADPHYQQAVVAAASGAMAAIDLNNFLLNH